MCDPLGGSVGMDPGFMGLETMQFGGEGTRGKESTCSWECIILVPPRTSEGGVWGSLKLKFHSI